MKLSLVLLSMASLAISQPVHEHHQHIKKDAEADAEAQLDVVTVFATQVVTKAAAGIQSGPASGASTQADTSSLSGSSFQTVLVSSSTTDPSSSTAATGSSGDSQSSTSSGTQSSSTSSSSSSGGGNSAAASGAKGITYSPYTNSGSCKDSSTIKSDIAKLSDFDIIRLYDTDCSGVENVLSAKSSNQKLFAGIYHISKIQDSVDIISSAIKKNGNWDDIYAVSVGNELVNSGEATVSDIKSAISDARSSLKSAGYSGKIVSVDTLVAVQNNDELCEYSDFIAVNSHPFWDGSVVASGSGDFLKTQISNIKSKCGGEKSVLICETGWPTKGDSYGKAVPSKSNQEEALKSIVKSVGDQVILFTTYNDLWKSPGSSGVEQYWGIFE